MSQKISDALIVGMNNSNDPDLNSDHRRGHEPKRSGQLKPHHICAILMAGRFVARAKATASDAIRNEITIRSSAMMPSKSNNRFRDYPVIANPDL